EGGTAWLDRVVPPHSPRNHRSHAFHSRRARGEGVQIRPRIGTDSHGDPANLPGPADRRERGSQLSIVHSHSEAVARRLAKVIRASELIPHSGFTCRAACSRKSSQYRSEGVISSLIRFLSAFEQSVFRR